MTLIIGGRAQGKRAYALCQTGLGSDHICDGEVCPLNAAFDQPILDRLHLLVRRLMEAGQDARQVVLNGAAAHPELTVICDEIGCGVVPVDAFERAWREQVGRICCALAEQSLRVVRVYAGLPTVLKGA
ncbi:MULTISPECIES: bifunctional adenosylcobinamide kinase/adenosylcobinamide-phosphate guanylyltransferase [Anaerotruncus]|uniref:Adenosylcobinamide-phosphate guanylyltransferase n=1 Tax=Anaerotruncus colihominis TaxID=169435 RepID=A0A845SSD1_9FIRM|nr:MULTISPECIES: bifunctional adenosylcobinamide kinase/adenosylcobinamide-phosphate guanylyltransferase [Anaerotruncus]MCI8491854.1 hypothetical protein [Anaerotruncus sp.]MCR2025804.1 bifunctional adenosylcobinamide kinase/adenosylcobinamide-phosphate guanylyltransferase [Anaerotruncus colihominis]NDO38645.1 hypothetical protein [Anaerotruncus colihominis]